MSATSTARPLSRNRIALTLSPFGCGTEFNTEDNRDTEGTEKVLAARAPEEVLATLLRSPSRIGASRTGRPTLQKGWGTRKGSSTAIKLATCRLTGSNCGRSS